MSRPARVQVRRGRQGLELRVDGTLASLHRPGDGLTGTVWWALAAPVVLLPRDPPARVLVLGLGGGSVVHALRALAPEAIIVGVEHDRAVVRAARRHFDLDRMGIELHAGDARDFLAAGGRRFDLIVEDLFLGPGRSVRKPSWLVDEGYPAIRRRLSRGGIVSINTIHETRAVLHALRRLSGRIVSLDVRGHWNRVLFWGRDVPPPWELRRRLGRQADLRRVLETVSVRSWRVTERGTGATPRSRSVRAVGGDSAIE